MVSITIGSARARFPASLPVRKINASVLAAGILASLGLSAAEAKTPGHTYCFRGICHRVKTIEETRAEIGKPIALQALFYDDPGRDRFNPSNITSSGEIFRHGVADNAASPVFPDGTKLLVWHPVSHQAAVIRVNNAGPYWGNRTLDLSRAAAEKMGFAHRGVAAVHVRVLAAPTPAEATYNRGRTYAPVPGFLGSFASIDGAANTAVAMLAGSDPASVAVAALDLKPTPTDPLELTAAPTTAVAETTEMHGPTIADLTPRDSTVLIAGNAAFRIATARITTDLTGDAAFGHKRHRHAGAHAKRRAAAAAHRSARAHAKAARARSAAAPLQAVLRTVAADFSRLDRALMVHHRRQRS